MGLLERAAANMRAVDVAERDTLTNPVQMVGFPSDGGLTAGGVSATTTLGLSAVWRCVDVLANGVSQLEWRERQGTLDLPPSRLVVRPQAQRTRREWTSLVVSTLALFDVCYLFKAGGTDSEGVPMGLWYLDPTIVTPASADMFTFAFLLPPDAFFVGSQRVASDSLVILHRSPQPTISDTAGGIINIARTTFAAAIAAERYASRYWQSGGSPTTVLETEQRLTPQQTTETSELWSEKRSRGPDFAPVLSGGLKARSFGADPTSESAVEARRELVADIGRYFGVPTRILNAPTGDSETYTSTPAANQDLIRYTLQNYIGAIEDGISDVLPPPRRMEMSTRKLVSGTQYEQAQAYQLATGNLPWMTPDEVRDEVGLPPVQKEAMNREQSDLLIAQVGAGLLTENEARQAMGLAPMQFSETISKEESDTLIAQIEAGLLTHDEARKLMGKQPIAWSEDLSSEEVSSLIEQVQAGLITHDEARKRMKLGPAKWSDELSKEESDALIAQVNAGLVTHDEARKLMKLPPMKWSEELSAEEIASLTEQIKSGMLTENEARAMVGRPEITWPEDLNEKVDQAANLIKAGFDPADVLKQLGLPPMKHLGLPPVTVQKAADAEEVVPGAAPDVMPGAAPAEPVVPFGNGRGPA